MERRNAVRAKVKWTQILSQWETSGKTDSEWCRDTGTCYKSFISWRKRLKGRLPSPPPSIHSSFIELPDKTPSKTGVDIHLEELRISVSKDFDPTTLLKVLHVLRKI